MQVEQLTPFLSTDPLKQIVGIQSGLSLSDKLNKIKERTQLIDRQQYLAESEFKAIHFIAGQALQQTLTPTLEESENIDPNRRPGFKQSNLKEKLDKIRQTTKEIKREVAQANFTYKKTIEIADQTLKQTDDEIEQLKEMKEGQKKAKEQMLIIHHCLGSALTKASILKEEQGVLSDEIKGIQESLEESHANQDSLFQDLDIFSLEMSVVTSHHQIIDQHVDELNKKVLDLESNQEKAENCMEHLMDKKVVSHIGEKMIEGMKNSGKVLQHFLQGQWKQVKNCENSFRTYVCENITYAQSKITSIATGIMFAFADFIFNQAINLCNLAWRNFIGNPHPITSLVLGVFVVNSAAWTLKTYPTTILVIAGCVFLVWKNKMNIANPFIPGFIPSGIFNSTDSSEVMG